MVPELNNAMDVTSPTQENYIQPDGTFVLTRTMNDLFGDPFPNVFKYLFAVTPYGKIWKTPENQNFFNRQYHRSNKYPLYKFGTGHRPDYNLKNHPR